MARIRKCDPRGQNAKHNSRGWTTVPGSRTGRSSLGSARAGDRGRRRGSAARARRGGRVTESTGPSLSVIVPADRYGTIAKVMNHLRAQTIADQIEVVIVTPSESTLGMDDK